MTQNERILRHMRDYGSITQADAATEYGCYRLSARIFELRKAGYPIVKETVTGKNRYGESTNYARYYIAEEDTPHG